MYWLTALAIIWALAGLYLAIKKPFLGALAGAAGVFMALWGENDALVLQANETNTSYYNFYVNVGGPAIILNGLVITVSLFMMMVAWLVQRRQLRTRLPEL